MPTPFNPARAMGVPTMAPDDDDVYSADEVGSPQDNQGGTVYPLSSVQSQPFTQPMALTTFNPVDSLLQDWSSRAQLGKAQAQADLMSGDIDWGSDEGRAKLQNLVSRGIVSPTEARAIIYSVPKAQKQNRYSDVPDEVATAISKLNGINPSDPDAWTSLQGSLPSADIQANSHYQPAFQKVRQEILQHQQQRLAAGKHDPDEDMISKAQAAGVGINEITPFLDEDGKVANKLGLREATFQAQNAPKLDPETSKRLADAHISALTPPSQPQKEQWLTNNGIEPAKATPDQWRQAWNGVKDENVNIFQSLVKGLSDSHYRRLPQLTEPTQPQAAPQMPSFNSEQEAASSGLPSGTVVTIGGRRARIN